jgi:hypothetical protein
MKTVPRLASLILLPILTLPLRAQDVQVGTALVCDTRQQVERFVALYDGDFDAAVSTVNAEVQNPSACAMASPMAYLVSPPLATERRKDLTFQIVQILVVGVITKNGVAPVKPTKLFSVLEVDEREA